MPIIKPFLFARRLFHFLSVPQMPSSQSKYHYLYNAKHNMQVFYNACKIPHTKALRNFSYLIPRPDEIPDEYQYQNNQQHPQQPFQYLHAPAPLLILSRFQTFFLHLTRRRLVPFLFFLTTRGKKKNHKQQTYGQKRKNHADPYRKYSHPKSHRLTPYQS